MVALSHVPANAAWAPNPGPQCSFLASPCREVGYGGSAGGGKTESLLIAAARFVDHAEHNAVIFRRSYPELRNVIRRSLEIYPKVSGIYNRSQHEWKFPSGAAIIFRYVGSSEDVHAYQGDSFTFIGWDELTQFPADAEDAEGNPINYAYQYMFSRLRRSAASKVRLQIRSTFNPGGIGHHAVKTRFRINDAGEPTRFKDPVTGYHRAFIPARIKDNPHLAGTEYEKALEALPETLRRALRDGRWDIFAGAMFSQWNPRIGEPGAHIVEPFHIPSDWQRWRGADDGFAAPAACVWMTKVPDTGQIVVYQELYRKGMTAGVFADEVKRLDREQPVLDAADPEPQDGLEGILDSAAFANNGQSEVSRGDVMNRAGCRWKPAEKGPGSRVLGVKAFHQRLAPMPHDPLKRPGIVFFKNCKNACRTIPALPVDTNNPEDVNCFVAGTLVETAGGPKPIESVAVGDMVMTPIGFCPALKSHRSGVAKVCRVTFSDGTTLEGTHNHKIFVDGVGLVKLSEIMPGLTLTPNNTLLTVAIPRKQQWSKSSNTTESNSDAIPASCIIAPTEPGLSPAPNNFTERFGNLSMGRFQKDTTSTTLTETLTITTLAIWSWLKDTNTPSCITACAWHLANFLQSIGRGRKASGERKRCAQTLKQCVTTRPLGNWRALIVESLLKHGTRSCGFARMNAPMLRGTSLTQKPARFAARSSPGKRPVQGPRKLVVSSVDGKCGDAEVFNLTVETAHLFYANGILASNTDAEDHAFDSVRYSLLFRSTSLRRVAVSGF